MGTQEHSGERPSKRPHLVHTLYSTLAKYGIKTGQPTSSVYPFIRMRPDFNSEPFTKLNESGHP
jgi:hypothetical protein